MSDREAFLRAFHAANPGVTQRVFARGGTYARLAERVPAGRVLDLACGDGPLLRLLGPRVIGVDISLDELLNESSFKNDAARVQARAQALPFGDRVFDAATCHLAFMLFDAVERVVDELARVLRPGAPFIALLGGGPAGEGRDAFHAYAELRSRHASQADSTRPSQADSTTTPRAHSTPPRLGDRRASTEAGWAELFAEWGGARDIAFERWAVDLAGAFDEVWAFLAASYGHPAADAAIRDALRGEFPGERVPCTAVTFLATVRR